MTALLAALTSAPAGALATAGHGQHRCAGKIATVVGTAGRDVLRGTPRADVIWGGPGADVVRGRGGDDTVCGSGGDDRILGGGGVDNCLGGPGHDSLVGCETEVPASQPDPVVVDVDVWSGGAHGRLDHGDGVVESWSATYTMAADVPGFSWSGSAQLDWLVTGTDEVGCSYGGHARVPGRATLTIWGQLRSYDHQVYRVAGSTVPVTVDCPGQEPRVVDYQPLNTNSGEASAELPDDMSQALTGERAYVPTGAPDGAVEWSWIVGSGNG